MKYRCSIRSVLNKAGRVSGIITLGVFMSSEFWEIFFQLVSLY